MKRYLVKFHGENDQGIPAEWPSDKDECTDFENIPQDCTLMNEEQYEAHVQKYKHFYDAWVEKQKYKKVYKKLREKEYDSHDDVLEVILDVITERLIDKRNFPEKLKKILDKRAEIKSKYPEPE